MDYNDQMLTFSNRVRVTGLWLFARNVQGVQGWASSRIAENARTDHS